MRIPMQPHVFKVGALWHYRFQINGRRIQRSTRETSRRRAWAIAQNAYHLACSACGSYSPFAIPTLDELAQAWLDAHASIASPSHLAGVDAFRRLHLYQLGNIRIDGLTTAAVEEARNQHLRSHAPSSVNHWSRIVRLLGNWAVHRGIIDRVPFKVKMLKLQRRPRTTLPVDLSGQWLAAIDAIASGPVRIATRLMLGMGLRESEAATARWEWLDLVRQTYTPGRTKGREADPVPVPVWLIDYLRPFRQPAGLIVVRPDGRPFARGFTRASIKIANTRIGIGEITPHRLRGTFATLLSENGAPVQVIQRVMRHKSPLTTIGYLEADLTHAARAQARIAEQYGFQ
ncbi:tyrosine-type recombinase/integrase [Burkholderia cepacia]|uniref:tyrosine-type recombinase/integrase n=1 Tax=Burkholderia cepacia TaxID=292 RepID=UPI000AEC75CA|nr:site-specific integrase [Burkholderia cepacia]